MILEAQLWRKQDLRGREENDELSRRIAELEGAGHMYSHHNGGMRMEEGKPILAHMDLHQDDDDMLDQHDDMLHQVRGWQLCLAGKIWKWVPLSAFKSDSCPALVHFYYRSCLLKSSFISRC